MREPFTIHQRTNLRARATAGRPIRLFTADRTVTCDGCGHPVAAGETVIRRAGGWAICTSCDHAAVHVPLPPVKYPPVHYIRQEDRDVMNLTWELEQAGVLR